MTETIAVPMEKLAELQNSPIPMIPFDRIDSPAQLQQASDLRAFATDRIETIGKFFDGPIDQAHKLHKELLAQKKQVIEPYTKILETCKNMMNDHGRRELERVAAEQKRLDDEAKAKAIAEAKSQGDKELAKDIKKGIVPVTSGIVVQAAKAVGVTGYTQWYANPNIDLATLVRAAARNPALLIYLQPNIKTLDNVISATKGKIVIPGVTPANSYISTQRRV